ncbi:hypothetical protein MKEN_00609500 [Mycena kentingensis (nom. inval.)]|nr:hypothetical protein MKEN_00609500 [Mycena kentingensis (nom. inval.)]
MFIGNFRRAATPRAAFLFSIVALIYIVYQQHQPDGLTRFGLGLGLPRTPFEVQMVQKLKDAQNWVAPVAEADENEEEGGFFTLPSEGVPVPPVHDSDDMPPPPPPLPVTPPPGHGHEEEKQHGHEEQHQPEPSLPKLELPLTIYPDDVGDWAQRFWMKPSEVDFQALRACFAADSCPENRKKIILSHSMYWRNTLRGDVGGEEVWAMSVIDAARSLGYTLIQVDSFPELVRVYNYFPDLVKVIFMDDFEIFGCFRDQDACLQTARNPNGIPGYKMLAFYFWTWPRHPLGPRWIVSPENYNNMSQWEMPSPNIYLGYSIERVCHAQPFIPHAERYSPPQVWIFAKLMHYFFPGRERNVAWSKEVLDGLAAATGIKYGIAAHHREDPGEEEKELERISLPEEKYYTNHVWLDQKGFMKELANSRALMGVANPITSPSPWNALCLGVPYINVVTSWEQNNPDNRWTWRSQHALASLLDPPYVYNVRSGDLKGLIAAVNAALANPIDSYIPDAMTLPSIAARLAPLVDRDWAAEERDMRAKCEDGPCGCVEPCDVHLENVPWPYW